MAVPDLAELVGDEQPLARRRQRGSDHAANQLPIVIGGGLGTSSAAGSIDPGGNAAMGSGLVPRRGSDHAMNQRSAVVASGASSAAGSTGPDGYAAIGSR